MADPNQQGLLSVMLESLHEWVESSFLSSLVRIGFFLFFIFFFSTIDTLLLCTVWFLCCLKDTKKKACVWNRKTITAKFWFNGVVTEELSVHQEIDLSNSKSCQGPLKSTDLWLSFPSYSGLLHLLPLQFETNFDCVFVKYVVQVMCKTTQVEGVEMCLMMLWLDEGVKNMKKDIFFIPQWSSWREKQTNQPIPSVFHTGQLINVNLGLWVGFVLFYYFSYYFLFWGGGVHVFILVCFFVCVIVLFILGFCLFISFTCWICLQKSIPSLRGLDSCLTRHYYPFLRVTSNFPLTFIL